MKDLATKNTKDTKKVWPKVRLGDVCVIKLGKTPPRGVGNCWDNEKMSGNVWVTIADMANSVDGKIQDSKEYITDYAIEASGIPVVEEGTLLLSFKLTLGRTAIAGKNLYTNEAIAALPIKPEFASNIDLAYLVTYFSFFDWVGFAANDEKLLGKTLNKKKLAEVPVLLPPLSTQREIVARLEKELGEADRLAAKFKRVAELADDAFKAELDETFKALEDNSRRDAETRRVRLGDVCEFVRNGANIKQRKGAAGIPITRIETLSGGVFNSQKVGYADIMNKEPFGKHIVGIGDLLISHINSAQFVGRTVMYRGEINGPIIHGMNLLRARLLDSGKILPAYVELWFKTISARIYISGVTKKSVNQASVNTTDFKRMPIIRPPISTQRAIIAKLDAAKERCEKLKAAAMRGHAAAENLRKAILAEAFEQ